MLHPCLLPISESRNQSSDEALVLGIEKLGVPVPMCNHKLTTGLQNSHNVAHESFSVNEALKHIV